MIRMMIAVLLVMLGTFAQAQPRPDLTPGQADRMREDRSRDGWRDSPYPRWCRMYDRRDYYQELRACGDNRACRHDVRRKGERCGLR